MASVKLENLTKRFGDVIALDNINLDIADQEFFVLLGQTGAGKTTALRCIAGLERPDEGGIFSIVNELIILPLPSEMSPLCFNPTFSIRISQFTKTLHSHYTRADYPLMKLRSALRRLPACCISNLFWSENPTN